MAVYPRTPSPKPRRARLESDRHLAVRFGEWGRAARLEAEIGRLMREEHDRMRPNTDRRTA